MNKELWDWGDEQQEQESQAPKRSLFDNLGDAITAIGANFSDVRGSNNIGDLRHDLMENGATMPLEEYNRKVAELEQLYGEREASRQQYQQAHDNLVANDSFLKNIDQLGGTLEGMAAQGIGTAVGAGLGLVGGVGGAAMGAKIGNAAGAVAGGYLDARSVALQAEEDVLDNGGTWEQARHAYDEALKKASLTTLPETLADIALGNRLVRAGLNSGMARKIAGSTIGRAGSAVLDPAARLGTKAAFKAGNTLVGRGVGLATDIAMQGSTEALQEVAQDYIGNRETAKALGQADNEYSLGGFKDYALSDQGLETMKTAGIMGALFGGAGGALSSGQYLTRGAETNTGIRAHNNAEQMINDGSLKISAEKRRDEEKIISVLKGISPAELASWSDAEIVAEASILEGQYMGVQGEAEDLSTVRGAADVVRRLSDENTGVHREGDLTETTNKFLEGMGVDKEQRQRMFNSPSEMSIIEQARKAQEAEANAKTQTQEQEGTQKKNAPVTATLTKKTAESMPKAEDGTITTKTDGTQVQTPQTNIKTAPQTNVVATQPTATPKAVTETPSQKSALNNLEQAAQVQAQQGQITTAPQNYKDNIGGGWETDQDRLDESLDEHPYYNLKTGAEVTIKHRADGQYAIEGTSGESTVHPTLGDAEQYLKDHKDQTVFQGTNGEETEETKEGTIEDQNIVPKGGVNAREGFSGQLISSVDDLYNFMLQNPNLISRGAFIEYVHAKHNIGFDNIDIYLDKKNEGRVYDSKTGKWGYVNAKKTRDEATGRAILQLYKGADFISAVHEIAHIGYDNLTAAEQRTFDKYAVKSMGQWIADMLDLNYDDAFKQRLNNLQNDQELQEKINKSPALRQTVIEFLNAEQNGIDLNNLTKNQREAIDERWAWEFSLWYTEGYTRGVQPKNVVERLLQRGCLSIIDELEGLHRLWEHIHHKDNNEIEDLYRNMGTNVERQAEEQAQTTATTTAATEQQPTETQSNNLSVVGLDINNFGGEQAIQFNVPTLGESYNEASRRAGYYNDAREKQWNLYRMRNLPSADGSVATNTRNTPDNIENRNISAPVESTYQNYVENDPNNFSDTDIKDLIQIGKDRSGKNRQRSRWARELLKQINPERVRRLDKEIADAQNTVNRMVDNTIEQDRQRQAQEKENNRRAEEQQRLNEYMDNYANEVMAQQVSAQNLTNKNENATVEQKREVANNGKTENTRGTENLQGNVGEVQGRGRVRSGNDNRTGEGRVGQDSVEERSEGNGKDISLLKNSKFKSVYNARKQKKTEVKDWRDLSDSDETKQVFVDALNASKEADMQHGVYVDGKTVEELKDCKVILHKNKMAGFAITPDGNIVGVFSNPKNPIRGILNDMIFIAHMMGGNRMDCFGNFLLHGYRACGFTPVARTTFAEEYYPADNPANNTIRKEKPDVFFLVKDNDNNTAYLDKMNKGEYKNDQIAIDDIPLIDSEDSYGDALGFQGQVLEGIQKKENKNKSTKEVADSLRPKEETATETQDNQTESQGETTEQVQESVSDEEFNNGLEKIKDSKYITTENGNWSFNDQKIAKEIFGDKKLTEIQKSHLFEAISDYVINKSKEYQKKRRIGNRGKMTKALDALHKKYAKNSGKVIGLQNYRFTKQEWEDIEQFKKDYVDLYIPYEDMETVQRMLDKDYNDLSNMTDREKNVYKYKQAYLDDAHDIVNWLQVQNGDISEEDRNDEFSSYNEENFFWNKDKKKAADERFYKRVDKLLKQSKQDGQKTDKLIEKGKQNKSETETPVQTSTVEQPVATTSEPVKTNTDNVEQTKQAKPTIPTDEIYSHLYFGDKTGKLKYNKDTKKIEYFVEEDNGRDPVTMRRRYKLVNKGEITPEQYQELRSKYEQDFKKTKGEAKDRIPNLVEGMKKEDFMYSAYREIKQSEKEKGEVAVELGKEKQTLVNGKSEEYARQNAAEQSFNRAMSGESLSGMEETELMKEDKEEAQKQIEQELPKVEKKKTEQTTTPKTSTTTTKKTTSTKTTTSKPKTTDPLSALHKKYKNITGTPIGEKGYVFKSDEKAFIEGFKGLIDNAIGKQEETINVAKQLDSWFQNDPTERNRMVRKYLSQYLVDAAQINTNQNTEVRHQEANRAEQAQEILDSAFPDTRFQFAWHSTEHDFTEFTLDHLLSGEGFMAHGWGLYFAKSLKKNKKNYFDKLGRSKYSGKFSYYVNGHDVTQQIYNFAPSLLEYRTNDKFMAKLQEEVKSLSNELNKLRNGVNSKEFYKDSFSGTMYHKGKQAYVSSYTGEIVNKDDIDDYINFIAKELRKGLVIQRQIREHGLKIQGSNKNKLLLVDIPEDNVLLKENKGFKDQPPKVQIALMKLVRKEGLLNGEENTISNKDLMEHFDEILGVDVYEYNGDIYGTLSWLLEDDPYGLTDEDTTDQGKERCSKLLNKYGIKGISYDGRFDGECAVIFDDKAIDVITKFRQEEGKWKSEKVDNARNREVDKQKAQRKLEKHRAKDNNTRFQLHSEEGLSKADTNSPEFKKWFEGSVLTNKDGSPKIFYRGIDQHYNPEFDKEEGSVVWVTDDLEQAESYRDTQIDMEPTLNRKTGEFTGKPSMQREFLARGAKKESGDLLEAYVSLKKPFNLGIVNDKKSPHDFYVGIGKQLQKDVKDGKITEQQMKSVLADLSYLNKKDAKGNYPTRSIENTKHFKKKFFNAFKKVGYDGVQGQEAGMFGDNRVNVYGVFDKGDIKSIYNKGTFDRNNKDTRFMYGGNQADNQTLLTPKLEKEYEKNFRNYMRLHGFSEAFIDKYFSNDKTGKEQMIPDNVLKGRNLFNKSFEEVFNEYNKQMVKDKGVKRGLDGRWRFEFSDKESKVDGKFVSNAFISKVLNDASKKYETKLQNVLKHDKLFEHYPELKEFKVVFATSKYDGLEDADGYSDFNEIALNVDSLKKEKNEKARLARIRKTLLHEVQHQIQDREGFASGGGATRRELQDRQKDFVTSYINKLGGDVETGKKLINAIEDVIKNIKKVPRNKRGALYDKIRNNAEYFGDNERDFIRKHIKAIINGYINDYQNENKKFGNYINNEIKEMCEYLSLSKDLNMNEELLKPIRQFRNVYWTTMGEIEARQTEQRADMTMEERSERTDVLDESVRKMKSFKDAPILVKETIPNIVDDEDTRFQEAAKPLTDEEIEEMDKKEEAEYKKRQKRIEDAKDSATLSDDYKDVYSVAFTKSAQGYAENRTRMEYFDNNDRYWDRTEDKSTGKVTYTRKTPFEHHQQVVTYNGVNDVTREEKKKSKPRQWLEWMKDQLIKYMFNDKHYLAKAARKLGVYDAYRKMIVTEGYALKANTALTQGIKYNGKRTRALNDIIRDVGEENQKEFIDYCIAHRIIDLANRTKLEKVSKDDKDAILIDGKYYKRVAAPVFQKMKPDEARKIIAEVKAGKNADMFEKNRRDFVEYNQALLHVLVEGGILTEKKFKEFCEVDPNFVPLAKVMDDADFGFSSIMAAHNLVNVETPIKKIGTSMREVANPFLEMQKRTAEYYSAAARNKAGQIFVNEIAEALDIKYDGNVVARGQQMINRVKVQEVNGELITKPDDKKQIIYVCNNGEHQFYQIPDREIYEALRSMDSEQMGTIHKMLDRIAHVPSGLVRETATMVPDFGVRNLIRDGGEAFLTSEHGFLPIIDQIWGMWQVANNTEWAQMYFEQNGEYGTLNRDKVNAEGVASVEDVIDEKLNPLTNFNEIKKAQMAILKDKKRQFDILTDIKDGNFGDAWEHTRKSRGMAALKLAISPLWAIGKTNKRMNDLFELGTRVGEFKNAKMGFEGTLDRMAKGLLNTDIKQAKQSDIYSAHVAKDITLNFAQHGVLGKQLNRYIPFFNASLQGIYKLCNTIETMVTGTTMSGGKNRKLQQELLFKAALITAMAICVASAGDGDEDYEEAPDYEKENFWILPNGLRFPKDQVLGKVIGNTVEKSYAQWKKGKAEPSDILRAIIDNFKPDKFMPAIFDLAIGGFGNYDTFRERAIVPEYMADKLGHLQKDISTSNFAVDVSEALWKCGFNISAKKIDWALQKNFSNCAKYATSIYDLGKKGFNPKDFNERIARGYDKNDSTGAFVAGLKDDVPNPINLVSGTFATNRSTFKSISDFYENYRKYKVLSSDEASMSKEDKRIWKRYEQAYKKDMAFRKQLRAIKQDKNLTGKQKREKADKIFKQQIKLAKWAEG